MITNLSFTSPFYAAYVSQSKVISAAVEKAVQESAEKMGDKASEIYSIFSAIDEEKLAA